MKTKTLVGLAIAVILGFLIRQALKTDYGVNADSVRWLPSEAHNITYMKMPGFNTIAEFAITQGAFEKWCTSMNKPLRKLGPGEEGSVLRCLAYLERRGVVPVAPEPNDSNEWTVWIQRHNKRLRDDDLYYEDRWDNGGGYVIGYDVEEGMGYYWYGDH